MKEIYGEKSFEVLGVTNNLAIMLSDIGSFEKSTKYLQECVVMCKALLGEDHLYYSVFSNNLARDYNRAEEYDKAVTVLEEALILTAEHSGTDIPQYGTMQGNLGMAYNGLKQFDKAEEMFLNNLALKQKLYGEKHISTIYPLNNLASLCNELGRFEESEKLFLETLDIIETTDGKFNRQYPVTLTNLSELYTNTKQYEKGQNLLKEYHFLNKQLLINGLSYFSEEEQKNYINRMGSKYTVLKSLGLIHPNQEYNKTLYDLALFEKGILLNNSISTKRFIDGQSDTIIINTYNDLISLRQLVGQEIQKPESQRTNIDSLEIEIEQLEKSLAKSSSEYRNEVGALNTTSEDIVQVLQADELAIEFSHFVYSNPYKTDSIIYAATVLDPATGKIAFVQLFEEKELKLFNQNKSRRSDYVNVLYSNQSGDLQIRGKKYKSLYQLIWEPLQEHLVGKKTIYYSCSGLLNRINLEAIYNKENKIMSESFEMRSMSSTRSVLEDKDTMTYDKDNSAYLVGGIHYDTEEIENDYAAVVTDSELLLDRSLTGGKWKYLPWTVNECKSINKTLDKNGFDVSYRKGIDATEESFKALGVNKKSPRIIHLATHGFFFPDPKKETEVDSTLIFKVSDNPMLRSGIILSGSNLRWTEEKMVKGKEDGILTALEISNVNLNNTELVVLSACETGLGDINGTEGVYGLQRAFKKAGVKYLIMSLWQVPDEQTAQFMDLFYKNWLDKNESIRTAFRQTQLEIKNKLSDPYQWAGFVLIE